MNQLLATKLIRALQELEIAEFPSPYSGRGMMGDQCVSFVTGRGEFSPLGQLLQLGFELKDQDFTPEEIDTLARGIRSDNMGRDSLVFYWPNLSWVDVDNPTLAPDGAGEEAYR